MTTNGLKRHGLELIEELDRLKTVVRKTLLHDGSRNENSAEHSWHLATSVWALADWANEPFDLDRAVKMALAHDIVEIDAGDTLVYDSAGHETKAARERAAADRLFPLASGRSGTDMRALWEAYEAQACPESRFVGALDRFLPILANHKTGGHSWKTYGITKSQVLARNERAIRASNRLWEIAHAIIEDAVARGWLHDR